MGKFLISALIMGSLLVLVPLVIGIWLFDRRELEIAYRRFGRSKRLRLRFDKGCRLRLPTKF